MLSLGVVILAPKLPALAVGNWTQKENNICYPPCVQTQLWWETRECRGPQKRPQGPNATETRDRILAPLWTQKAGSILIAISKFLGCANILQINAGGAKFWQWFTKPLAITRKYSTHAYFCVLAFWQLCRDAFNLAVWGGIRGWGSEFSEAILAFRNFKHGA
jgi:hypothetical protein